MFKNADVVFANNTPKYRYMKKHMMYALKQYGDGLKHLESQTAKCGTELLEKFAAHGNNAFDPYSLLQTCVAILMMNLAYGESSQPDVDKIIEADAKIEELFEPTGIYLLLDIFPALRFILPTMRKAYSDLVDATNNLHEICIKLTESRKKKLSQGNQQPEFYIDHFLSLKNKQILDRKKDKDIIIDDDNVNLMGINVLLGGISGTTNTLYILLGILVNHPTMQDRAFEEITSVLGGRIPTIGDKGKLPFIEALILETFRYSAFAPLLVPHYTTKQTELYGYLIPENTAIFSNVWNLQHDERYWDHPWVFDPLRFIENESIVPADHESKQRILMFSAGKRQCPGELYAKNRLFILVTMMLHKYKFLGAKGFPKPKHDPREYLSSLGLQIKPYHFCVQARK